MGYLKINGWTRASEIGEIFCMNIRCSCQIMKKMMKEGLVNRRRKRVIRKVVRKDGYRYKRAWVEYEYGVKCEVYDKQKPDKGDFRTAKGEEAIQEGRTRVYED